MKRFTLILFLLLFTELLTCSVKFNGYFKSFSTYMLLPDIYKDIAGRNKLGALSNRLSLKTHIHLSESIAFTASYSIFPVIKDPLLFDSSQFTTPGRVETGYRLTDLNSRILPESDESSSFGLFQNLDRFYISFNTDFAEITAGRQAIAWGSAKVINPTDIFTPFSFNELDNEERKGVDALRVRIPTGDLSEIDIGYISGKRMRLSESAFYIRTKFQVSDFEISLVAADFYNNLMAGIDITGALKGAGFRIETSINRNNFFSSEQDSHLFSKTYFRLSAGIDYSFTSDLYTYIEYHYNSSGSTAPENYSVSLLKREYTHGPVYLLGRNYLFLGAAYQIQPLIPVNMLFLLNIDDKSICIAPSVEYNISQNIYLSAGAFIGTGKKPLFNSENSKIQYRSEFRTMGTTLYTSFRIYF